MITGADREAFKAIFGFTDEQIDEAGDDKRVLELLVAHRLLGQREGLEMGADAVVSYCRDVNRLGKEASFVDAVNAIRAIEVG